MRAKRAHTLTLAASPPHPAASCNVPPMFRATVCVCVYVHADVCIETVLRSSSTSSSPECLLTQSGLVFYGFSCHFSPVQ